MQNTGKRCGNLKFFKFYENFEIMNFKKKKFNFRILIVFENFKIL
jgi:hypothetical protein